MGTERTLPDLGPPATPKRKADPMMSYEEWERMLHKAWSEGLWLVPHPNKSDLSLCLSQTKLNENRFVQYTVGLYGCSCPARRPCKHRALWLFEHPDLLPLAVDPVPPTGEAANNGEELSA